MANEEGKLRRSLDKMSLDDSPRSPTILPWDRFQNWLHCVCIVTFDLELGQAMEVIWTISLLDSWFNYEFMFSHLCKQLTCQTCLFSFCWLARLPLLVDYQVMAKYQTQIQYILDLSSIVLLTHYSTSQLWYNHKLFKHLTMICHFSFHLVRENPPVFSCSTSLHISG